MKKRRFITFGMMITRSKAFQLLPIFLVLLSCWEKKPVIVGAVDEAQAVRPRDLAEMGVEEARRRYLGKTVTFKGMTPVGIRAKNEERENVCMQGFTDNIPNFKNQGPYGVAVRAYFNYGEEIREWMDGYVEGRADGGPDSAFYQGPTPFHFNFDVCDTNGVCAGDGGPDCRFSSPHFLLAGKVIYIEKTLHPGIAILIRPSGVRY